MSISDLDRAIVAMDGCEQNLRLIHRACGAVPKDAPMPSMSTFEAWHAASEALATLRSMRERAVEGPVTSRRFVTGRVQTIEVTVEPSHEWCVEHVEGFERALLIPAERSETE